MTYEYILKAAIADMAAGRRAPHRYSAHVHGSGYVNNGDDPATLADYRAQLVRTATSDLENMQWSQGYAEPGYDDPKRGILFSNWNHFPRGVDDLLEKAGYAIEWEDEWSTCHGCGKAVRESPNCYSWQPSYIVMHDCERLCLECVDWAEYLESIEDNPRVACMACCDPEEHGYRRLSDAGEYESGFHAGQTDDPVKILAQLKSQGKTGIVFRVSETSQFYIRFEVYQRIAEDA